MPCGHCHAHLKELAYTGRRLPAQKALGYGLYTRDHSMDDSLRQMGWIQGAIWSNAQVRESVAATKEKRAGAFPDLPKLGSFPDLA